MLSAVDSPERLLGVAPTLDDVGPARRGRAHPSLRVSALLLLPAACVVVVLIVFPVGRIVYASVTDDGAFVGLRHFRTMGRIEGVGRTFLQSFVWATAVPAVVTTLGLMLARLSRRVRSPALVARPLLALVVLPIGVPLVVTAVAFRLLLDPDPQRGLVTDMTRQLPGAFGEPLLGPRWITPALMAAFVWVWLGLATVVFRTALDRLPPELADAVRTSGGSRWDVFRDAEWRPLVRRTYAIVFALVALATVRAFDLILVMAPGSVVDEASVLSVLQWQTTEGETTGPASALGVLWFAAVLVGVTVAALGSRQSWPPPARQTEPAPVSGVRTPETGTKTRRTGADRWVALTVVPVAVWLLPLLVLVGTAFHGRRNAVLGGWWEPPFGLGSFRDAFAWDQGLLRSLGLTFSLATFVTTAVVVLALLAAYALAWVAPPGAHVAGVLLLGTAVVPIQVIATPVTDVLEIGGLSRSPLGLALVHAALGLPFAVLLLRNALGDLPPDQVRSERLAQARAVDQVRRRSWLSRTRTWRSARREGRIIRSFSRKRSIRSVLVAVALLEFVQVWNDLVVGLLFGGAETVPLGVLIQGETRQFVTTSGSLAATAAVASLLPATLLALGHRRVVEGLVTGVER